MKQFWSLITMNLASIPQRLALVCTIIVGVTCAVGVLVSMLAMGAGAQREAMGNVRPDRVILMSTGAMGPGQSSISKDDAAVLRDLPGIRRGAAGRPFAIAQAMVVIQARNRKDGRPIAFPLVGVTQGLTDVVPELHITAGRLFKPGLHELIASNKCARELRDFSVGDRRNLRGGEWTVVGNFDAGKAEGSCTVYADADTVVSAYSLAAYNSVMLMLGLVTDFDALVRAIKENPSLHLQVRHEEEVVAQDMQQLKGILDFVSYFVGTIMAAAATVGAANSLYAIADGRRRELATLRAVGFRGTPIILSVLTEAMLLALPGALIGAFLAWLAFNGMLASPFGATFRLAVTPALVQVGVIWALFIGLISGWLPAVRSARVPVTVALRES